MPSDALSRGRDRVDPPQPILPIGVDLHTVERLCGLHLAARRLGCRMLVHDASPELRALLCLVGLDEVLLAEPRPDNDPRP